MGIYTITLTNKETGITLSKDYDLDMIIKDFPDEDVILQKMKEVIDNKEKF